MPGIAMFKLMVFPRRILVELALFDFLLLTVIVWSCNYDSTYCFRNSASGFEAPIGNPVVKPRFRA